MARMHAPSEARALVQEARRPGGRPVEALLALARALPDPGHAAETLATLAAEPGCPPEHAAEARRAACQLAGRVERAWRRAEVMGTIMEMTARAEAPDRDRVEVGLVDLAAGFDVGEARRDVLAALAPHAGPDTLGRLFDLAVANGQAPWDEVRLVLRAWLDKAGAGDRAAITQRIGSVRDAALRARMLAYVDRRVDDDALDPLDGALQALAEIDPADAAIEGWRAVVQKAQGVATLTRIHARLGDADPEVRIAILPALVGRAYREGDDPSALAWHDETLATLPRVVAPLPRVRALVNLAKAHARAGHTERLDATTAQARRVLETMTDPLRTTWTRKLEQAAGDAAPQPTKRPERPGATAREIQAAPAAKREATTRPQPTMTRLVHHALALHDTYAGGLTAAHLRAVARAAPLCDAFDLALVLFDFPVQDAATLVQKVEAETNIGEGGGSLRRLVAADRVRLVALEANAPPSDWSALGVPVATTPHPARERRTSLEAARAAAGRFGVDGERVCLVMGLGRQGLPKRWLDTVSFHYEITGRDVSLETATAMGILAERLRALGPARGAAGEGRGAP